jgi:nucleoside-diphosphate-sugar epimerase
VPHAGATGFIGSLVVELLLRTTNVGRIYVLARGKRGSSARERVQRLLHSGLFHQIRDKGDLVSKVRGGGQRSGGPTCVRPRSWGVWSAWAQRASGAFIDEGVGLTAACAICSRPRRRLRPAPAAGRPAARGNPPSGAEVRAAPPPPPSRHAPARPPLPIRQPACPGRVPYCHVLPIPLQSAQVVLMEGDLTQENMGLSPDDAATLTSDVQHVVHCASIIEAEADVQRTLSSNYLGTKRLLLLAARMARLRAMVHLSAAHANVNQPPGASVDEVIYPLMFGNQEVGARGAL